MSAIDPVYKLSAILEGHDLDVRSVREIDSDHVVSCSRDATVRVWSRQQDENWTGVINYHSDENKFINCLNIYEKDGSKYIASGGNDKLVTITPISDGLVEPSFVLVGHEANVCSLDSALGLIISGSWDKTAKVWENFKLKYDLKGHQGSVWDVKIVGEDTFLTCGADLKIILWAQDNKVKEYLGHQDVVRGLALLPDGERFLSCSNDGTIKIWELLSGKCLQTLTGHDSFIYSLTVLSNGDLISGGEDRSVRVWRSGKCVQVITFPCISVWNVSIQDNDDLIAGSSDYKVRIFTRSSDRVASKETQDIFSQEVEKSGINENTLNNLNKEKIPDSTALEKIGKEGETIMVKLPTGVIEAHQWTGGEWVKIGEVVGAASKDKKQEYDGKFYDYVFDVDVKDGAPPLKLAFNVTDNPYVTAANFLERHELPASYQEEIVRFILDNTKGVTLGEQKLENPYADNNEVKKDDKLKILPQTIRLQFSKPIEWSVIEKVNSGEGKKLSEAELLELKLNFLDGNGVKLFEKWLYINENFENKVFSYDLLRSIIKFLSPEILIKFDDVLRQGLKETNLNIVNLSLKVLCNISHEIVTPIKTLSPDILSLDLDLKLKLSLATLLLNLSTYRVQSHDLLPKLAQLIDSEVGKPDSEIAYRSLIAIGNLAILENDLGCKKFLQTNDFKWESSRFSHLYNDFNLLK